MGYSGRYHAASLTAVFIALAVGILIGVGLADDVVSTASQNLEDSLRAELAETEERVDALELELDRERDFSAAIYPSLVRGRLDERQVAVVSMGGLSRDTTTDVAEALEPTGAEVSDVAVVGTPVDKEELAEAAGGGFDRIVTDDAALRRFARSVGRQLYGGGPLIEAVGEALFSREEGDLGGVESVVFVASPESSDEDALGLAESIVMEGIIQGAANAGGEAVAVARSGAPAGALEPYREADVDTVDHLDIVAGKTSLVLLLAGANGDFGTGEGADGLVPQVAPRSGNAP